jgi:hypothetical protein
MKKTLVYLLSSLGIFVLLLSACDSLPAAEINPAEPNQDTVMEVPSGAQQNSLEVQTDTSGDDVQMNSPANLGEEAGGQMEVNMAPNDQDQDEGEGMTVESGQVSDAVIAEPGQVDPDDSRSLEEREAMLDGVNLSGPVFPESEQAPVSEGPPPGSESQMAGEGGSDGDFLDDVNRGGPVLSEEGDTTGEGTAPPPIWSWIIQTLSDWLSTLFN